MSAPSTAATPPIAGLEARGYRAGDAAIVTDLNNRGDEADGLEWRSSPEETAAWLERSNDQFDVSRDVEVVELGGVPVAFSEVQWIDTTDGLREYRLGGMVDPDWRRRGIGRWLMRRMERHAGTLAARYPTELPQVFGSWCPDSRVGKRILLEQEDYQPARWFFEMVRHDMEQVELPPLPEGIEVRPVAPDAYRQLWDADVEAFQDHWGGFDGSEVVYQSWLKDPKFDPRLWVVAWDGDEIAGGVINTISEAENAAFNRRRGWLQSVFTRRPWRRRGLARALVGRSLVLLRERGMTSAGLGVDADNPQAATRIYEEAGFAVDTRSTAYRKPMPMDA
jgi:GNAT superfamily N-acetyltransferase